MTNTIRMRTGTYQAMFLRMCMRTALYSEKRPETYRL
jgi:hypothetical protein